MRTPTFFPPCKVDSHSSVTFSAWTASRQCRLHCSATL